MFDQTLVSNFVFMLLKLGLWIGVVLYGVTVVRRIVVSSSNESELLTQVSAYKSSILIWVVVLFVALFISGVETGYRPKTQIQSRNEYGERLRTNLGTPVPTIVEAEPARPSWQEEKERNRAENESARRSFDDLPDAE